MLRSWSSKRKNLIKRMTEINACLGFNEIDRVLKELGDLYEFNRKIKEFKFVQKSENPQTMDEDASTLDTYRKSREGSE